MRKILKFGTVVFILGFAVAEAGAVGGGNIRPEASPYALFSQQFNSSPPIEGRSADIGEFYQPSTRHGVSSNKKHQLQQTRQLNLIP